jgi:hypothetical protein
MDWFWQNGQKMSNVWNAADPFETLENMVGCHKMVYDIECKSLGQFEIWLEGIWVQKILWNLIQYVFVL